MFTPYNALKFVHIVLAIVAVGLNASYGLIIGRARRAGGDGRELRFALRTIRFMDNYVANPCYILLPITGVGLVQIAGYPWALKWIHGSMALLLVLAVLGFAVYSPTLRRQIAALESGGPTSPEFIRLAKRGGMLGGVLALLALTIVALMVFKPA